MKKIIEFIVTFSVISGILWGGLYLLDKASSSFVESPRCWSWTDDHFVLEGRRYIKQYPISCNNLDNATKVAEQSCYKLTKRDDIEIKIFVECPDQ